eukprot:127362-Chlamydomonas_euryale.AAC.2
MTRLLHHRAYILPTWRCRVSSPQAARTCMRPGHRRATAARCPSSTSPFPPFRRRRAPAEHQGQRQWHTAPTRQHSRHQQRREALVHPLDRLVPQTPRPTQQCRAHRVNRRAQFQRGNRARPGVTAAAAASGVLLWRREQARRGGSHARREHVQRPLNGLGVWVSASPASGAVPQSSYHLRVRVVVVIIVEQPAIEQQVVLAVAVAVSDGVALHARQQHRRTLGARRMRCQRRRPSVGGARRTAHRRRCCRRSVCCCGVGACAPEVCQQRRPPLHRAPCRCVGPAQYGQLRPHPPQHSKAGCIVAAVVSAVTRRGPCLRMHGAAAGGRMASAAAEGATQLFTRVEARAAPLGKPRVRGDATAMQL